MQSEGGEISKGTLVELINALLSLEMKCNHCPRNSTKWIATTGKQASQLIMKPVTGALAFVFFCGHCSDRA